MSKSISFLNVIRSTYSILAREFFVGRHIVQQQLFKNTCWLLNLKSLPKKTNSVFVSSFVVAALSFSSGAEKTKKKIMEKADELYNKGDYEELKTFLTTVENQDDNVLWRLARATYEVGKTKPNKEDKRKYIEEAFAHVTLALELNENNGYAHKWYAILLNSLMEYRGTKEKVLNAPEIKKHLEKAIGLISDDATTVHILGVWCYSVADISWLERQLASKLFATPPSSSYEEALKYFEDAEKISPSFYNANLLYLGKCYLKLNQTEKAKEVLLRARDYPQEKLEDKKIHDEAIQLLKKLGVN